MPVRALVPSMMAGMSFGSNCGSANTHFAPFLVSVLRISASRRADGFTSGLSVMAPAA